MYRQFSSRNQRNKGFRVKHALQIFLMVAVCCWLIYQVKHSYDKKKDFDDNDARSSQHVQTNDEIMKLGRKDPHPQVKEPSKKNEKHNEEVDEDMEVDIKAGGKEDEVKGGGDVEVDEHDQQKSDSELDIEKVIIDEEEELEGADEKKNEEKVVTDKDTKIEIGSSEDNLDRDRGTENTHEAREEQYKADDASSAVPNDGQTFSSESESGNTQNQTNTLVNENKGSITAESIVSQNNTDLKVHEETAENGTSSMVNSEKGSEILNSTSQGSIFHIFTVTTESTDKSKFSNDTAEVNTELHDQLNGTEFSILNLSHAQNDTDEGKGSAAGSNIQNVSLELTNNFSIAMANSPSDSNTTGTISPGYVESNIGALSNFSNNQTELEHTAPFNASAETKDASEISMIEKNRDAYQSEKLDLSTGADGNSGGSDSSNTESVGKIENETVDSIVMEDKLPEVDLDTLQKLRMVASNSEVAANE